MSIPEQIRRHFLNDNLGAELTLKEISAAIDCDDNRLLGIALWGMVKRTRELTSEKNAAGKNVYRWNGGDRERAAADKGVAKPKRTGKERGPRRAKVGEGLPPIAGKPAPTSRWALTEDGSFIDLAPGGAEITAPRARSLVEFIRTLDRGEASA